METSNIRLDNKDEQQPTTAEKAVNALDVAIELLEDVQNALSGGPAKKVRIKLGNRVIAEIPVALAATAGFALGISAVLLSKLVIEIDN